MFYVVYTQGEQEDWIQGIFLHEEDAIAFKELSPNYHLTTRSYKTLLDWLELYKDE